MPFYKPDTAQYPLVKVAEIAFDHFTLAATGVAIEALGLPPDAEVIGGALIVDTAWVGPTVATADVGDAVSGARYANDVNLKATGRTPLTITGHKYGASGNILFTPTLTVADATAGAARLTVEYIRHGRQNEVQD